jgi:hypothetical protein
LSKDSNRHVSKNVLRGVIVEALYTLSSTAGRRVEARPVSTQTIVIIVAIIAVIALLAARGGGPRITQITRTRETKDDDK